MKKYELIPIHEQNLWKNWENTYISYTNSRIESLRQYKNFYSRDYLIYETFAFRIDNDRYQQIVKYQDIVDNAIDIRYIMISTQEGNGDYSKNKDKVKYIKDTKGNYKAYLFKQMTLTATEEKATHVLQETNNGLRYVEKNKAENLNSKGFYILEQRQLAAVVKAKDQNGNETKYFDSNLKLYRKEKNKDGNIIYEYEKSENSSKTLSSERYHLIFRDWFTIDKNDKKVYFNNSELRYRECFTNSFELDFPLILGGNLPVLFTIVNDTMIGYKQKLKSSDFVLRVQNPLSGYRIVSTSNGKIIFEYYKDLSSNTNVSFDLVVGSSRLVKTEAEGIGNTPTSGPRNIYMKFKKPNVTVGMNNGESYSVEGLNPLDGFVPIVQRETIKDQTTVQVEPVYEADFKWNYISDQKIKVNYTTYMSPSLNIEYDGF